jgi:hypothetical protein
LAYLSRKIMAAHGYIKGMPGEARNRPATKKRPDYFLVGYERTVVVGTEPLYGLMVASRLKETGIQSYVFDPPGDDELWSGTWKISRPCCLRCRRRSSGYRAGGSIPQSHHP